VRQGTVIICNRKRRRCVFTACDEDAFSPPVMPKGLESPAEDA